MSRSCRAVLPVVLLLTLSTGVPAARVDRAYVERLEYAAILADLNGRLLSGPSATKTLAEWCGQHRLAAEGRIVAERVKDDKPITAEQRARLAIGPDEPVRYRHVRLRCGERILSEADNWYVPARLTPEMNAALDGSDVPFGTVVAPLGIGRRNLSAELLWRPLPDGWEMRRGEMRRQATHLKPPSELIRHRAIVHDRGLRPIAEVTETYRAALLDFIEQ